MTVRLFIALLDVGMAVDAFLSAAQVWGPSAVASIILLALAWIVLPDSARTRVRTPSAPLLLLTRCKPLTCRDTCPDTSADTGPDPSGHDSRGGR
ncbi:hypothetical protein [Streptomyces griseofuscus]|uniref:Uncharacterized protein n=1 Tax=Streptomyces griseofuscus TaxID=146922 RepID=A0A7H1Q3H1_9ACTN|nr:hypothetical protein [Streptomyces griseofuscus]QNT94851.1 hypothetical protein HEP81_04578 [Streptomyces griseofuscus]